MSLKRIISGYLKRFALPLEPGVPEHAHKYCYFQQTIGKRHARNASVFTLATGAVHHSSYPSGFLETPTQSARLTLTYIASDPGYSARPSLGNQTSMAMSSIAKIYAIEPNVIMTVGEIIMFGSAE